MTECKTERYEFHALGSREVVAHFDGGDITSDAGGSDVAGSGAADGNHQEIRGMLSGIIGKRDSSSTRLRIWWRNESMGCVWDMKILTTTINCGRIRRWP